MAGVHYSNKLEDQAASTALHSHKEQRRPSVLDEDGKLSSASAALSLKYAQAQDLPSFPSAGLKMSSAGAAASIADSNKKNFEHWKPGSIPAANRAAMLAKDYEMEPLWQPEMSAAGSKAALLAHRDTESPEIWRSKGTAAGHSAAGQAIKSKPPNAITEREVSAEGRQKALLAATGAMSGNRRRSGSLPVSKGENTNWALKAATSSQKGVPNSGPFTTGDPGFEAARIQNLAKGNVNRQMFGSTPPVALEVEEKNRQDTLRASAVAMAKKMYAIQQTHIDEAAGLRKSDSRAAATSSHRRTLSDSSSNAGDETPSLAMQSARYENLEEAARRLAQERLAKLHDEHAEYRQYYGAGTTPARSRLSMRLGRRASLSARDNDDSSDEEQSRRIKKQMSIFQSKLAEVDGKKRQADRDALLEAAHRNVEARMAKMDDKIFQETGKASPAQKELWEQQAREKAQKASDERMVNVGKVHIGGGKYLDQSEIDAIARARLQPTFDEISETAEKQRARDAEIKAEAQRAADQLARDKAREAEVKAELKAAQEKEKLEARKKKEEEKAAQKEQQAIEKKERAERVAKEKEEAALAKRERDEKIRKEKEKAQQEKDKAKAEAAAEKEKARIEKEEKRRSVEVKPSKLDSVLRNKDKEGNVAAGAASQPITTELEGNTVHDQVTVPTVESENTTTLTRSITPTQSTEKAVTAKAADTETEDSTVVRAVPTAPTTVTAPAVPAAPAALNTTTVATGKSPTSPTRRESKVKTWFKSLTGSKTAEKEGPDSTSARAAGEETGQARDESIRDVAMAGRESDDLYGTHSKEDHPVSPIHEADENKASKASSISSYSTREEAQIGEAQPLSGTQHTAQVGRAGLKPKLMKKVKSDKDDDGEEPRESFITATTTTTTDDSDDDFKEVQDKVEPDKLALPPSISSAGIAASPRTSHEQSKFKEEL